MNSIGDHVDIPGYVLDALPAAERAEAEHHLADCPECRAEVDSLGEWGAALSDVPAEMLLDGPPEDADLLLQRTLRQVRTETAARRHRRTAMLTSAAAVVLAVAVVGGVAIGRGTAPDRPLVLPTVSVPASTPAGTRTASVTDPQTGARLAVAVLPAAGWVRVNATVAGIPAGQRCRLEVLGRDGVPILAGSWLVSETGATNGTVLNGSALIDPAQVTAVRVINTDGRQFVSASV
jgi:anti-sigma-K factor RskA